jgi:elongation factor G
MSYQTNQIRNVVLLGHASSGKTTFSECMLFEAGAVGRRGRVADANTQSDYQALEQEKQHSLFTSVLHCKWKDNKINILDTPGLDDFVGEISMALKVADTAIMVLNAKNGVEVGAQIQWESLMKAGTPTMLVVNQLDHDKADYFATIEQANQRLSRRIIPFQFPIRTGSGFNAIIDALRMIMYYYPDGGGKPEKRQIPKDFLDRAKAMHQVIVEAAAENEETLMDHFFENGTLDEAELAQGLRIGMAHQQFFPLFCASAERNMGSGRIMGFIHDVCPSPADRPAAVLAGGGTKPCDQAARPCVFVFKTTNEPKVGQVSYFKVYSGTLRAGDELINSSNQSLERFNQLYVSEGKNREPVATLHAGDIGSAVKMRDTHTNETLNPKGSELQIAPIDFPSPRIRMAVIPPGKLDIEKMAVALHTIKKEDPTLHIEQSQELRQTIIEGQGEMHLDIVRSRALQQYGVKLQFETPRIPYRETITTMAETVYRHKKQSGGAGQFAEVHMRIEPYYDNMPAPNGLTVKHIEVEDLPWGGKWSFVWAVVGGAIDARFINAIKKGIMAKMEEGPLTGSRCRDIRVSIFDGKMHPVDSNDMAFQTAASQAFRECFMLADAQLMEPIYDLEVRTDAEFMGAVNTDLSARRAVITGMDSDDHYQIISARVPLIELDRYTSALRGMTQGRAHFKMQMADYQSVPADLQKRLMDVHHATLVHA